MRGELRNLQQLKGGGVMGDETGVKLPVHIRQNCEVDYEGVNVRKLLRDEIVWHSDGDEFTVQFPISPFDQATFVVPAGGSISSGPVRADAPVTCYCYNITNVALAMSADPDVNVKR
jgi:hypothetical protein